tara:strand:+ start:618 stop:803 length:186 start_codon:yes stop_codon:yes gene_type:complete
MAKPKYILSLQSTIGSSPKISFEITGNKTEKILALIRNDIHKAQTKKECSSGTLERFFENN